MGSISNTVSGSLLSGVVWVVKLLVAMAATISVIVVVILLWNWITPERDGLWSVGMIDRVVLVGIAILLVTGVLGGLVTLIKPRWSWAEWFREDAATVGTAFVVLLGLYVAYGSFRNQSRLTAELALNQEGSSLFEIEMAHPEIRCVYLNYGHEEPSRCLENLAISEASWSFAIYYVEESWFILKRAYDDRINWGSHYAQAINYWAEDVSRDPTGLFGYYLISSSASLAEAAETMREADVGISNPCANFRRVWAVLERRGKLPSSISGAAAECGIRGRPIYQTRS